MFLIQLLLVVAIVQCVWASNMIEGMFINSELMDIFSDYSDDYSGEINGPGYHKHETSDELNREKEKLAQIVAPIESSRADHYWTRKRGRDKPTNPSNYDQLYYNWYTFRPRYNNGNRWKRATDKRQKRRVEIDDPDAQIGKNETEVENTSLEPVTSTEKYSPEHHEDGSTHAIKLKKCCAVENNISETLKLAKAQCLVETRKSRKPYNESEDFIDGDGELYTMFSCDRIKRWKTFVTCTIECIAQKVGMLDSHGVIKVDVANKIIIENFAGQEWEKKMSDEIVEKCAKAAITTASKPVAAFGFQCSSKVGEFAYCIWRELFLTCPVEKQQNTKRCAKMRKVLKKSDDNKFQNL